MSQGQTKFKEESDQPLIADYCQTLKDQRVQ